MIEIQKAEFGYPGVVVAGPIDLSVAEKEIVAIVGPSGCGKTTILRTISGETPLLYGTVRLDGGEQDRGWRVRHLARTLQSFPLFHWLTVEENLRLAAQVRQAGYVDVDQVLSEFSALHLKHKFPKVLSGGERCRASLAQAVLSQPKVLLLDEPFTGLDLHVKEEIAQRLFSFADSHKTSIVFVTHDLHDACEYAKRVVVLNGTTPATISTVVNPRDQSSHTLIRNAMLQRSKP